MLEAHFLGGGGGGGGSGVRDMAPPSLGDFGSKLFPHIKTYFMQIGHCYLKTTI